MQHVKQNLFFIPNGKFSVEDPLEKKRKELKKKLEEAKNVSISKTGDVNPNPTDATNTGNNIQIPPGKLAVDDDPLEKKRKELKKKLEEAKNVSISKTGAVNPNPTDTTNTGNNIQIPPGKLANFHWYDRDPELYQAEITAMNNSFPNFKLNKLEDGRLYWEGEIQPKLLGNHTYHLMLAYDNNHPNNSSYGGSVKCYLVTPDIEEMEASVGRALPHLLLDSAGNKYLCTSEKENFKASSSHSTSASSCLRWAVKWIAVYELYVGGEATYEEFAGHGKF